MKNILNTMATFTLAFGFIIVGLTAFWLFYPYKPIVFNTPTFRVLTPKVKQGGALKFIIDDCKYMNLPATVDAQYVDEIVYAIPSITVNNPTGCHSNVVVTIVPPGLPPGIYHMVRMYNYPVNPIRKVTTTISTDNFEVVE